MIEINRTQRFPNGESRCGLLQIALKLFNIQPIGSAVIKGDGAARNQQIIPDQFAQIRDNIAQIFAGALLVVVGPKQGSQCITHVGALGDD